MGPSWSWARRPRSSTGRRIRASRSSCGTCAERQHPQRSPVMAERAVYLNGQYVAERDAKVSVLDRGFRWGDAVYDATRTFEGRLFKLHEHVERFFRSLRYARIDPRLDQAAGAALCEERGRRNHAAGHAAAA